MSDDYVAPKVDPEAFARYHRSPEPMRGGDPAGMMRRNVALGAIRDPRLWTDDAGNYTTPVLAAAAVATCTSKGFDVDELVKLAAAAPRPPLERIHEPWFTEAMLRCNKCGAWWRESENENHKPDC